MRRTLYILRILLLSAPCWLPFNLAIAVDLTAPIACDYGEECFIKAYFDHNADPMINEDYACGILAPNGHTSTDFLLRNQHVMQKGIPVLAGDSGIVEFARDGMNDVNVDLIGEEAIRGKECGNAITISHKRGFTTQYCHLRKNSIAVKKGEAVSKGQQIAEVGMSGLTSFPYLEFTVKSEENLVDPFTGADPVSSSPYVPCGSLDIYPLWDRDTEKKLKYLSSALLGAGFSQKPPHPNGVRAGKFNNKTLPDDTKFLIFWVDIFGIQKGDTLRILITDEEGTLLKEDLRHFKNSKTHHYQFLGTPHSNGFWPAGVYTATITLERTYFSAPENIFKETRSVTIKGTN